MCDFFLRYFCSALFSLHNLLHALNVKYNAKLSRYNSIFYQPGAEVVDAFTQNGEGENNWILPSVSQISRVITHMRACKAAGTLVIPIWKSSYFWVLLCDDGKHWNEFVHDWVILPKYTHLFIRDNAKNHVFDSKDLSFTVIALRLNLSSQGRSLFRVQFCTVDGGSCSQCYNF